MAIVKNEPTFQGSYHILFTVAGEMDNVATQEMRYDILHSCRSILDAWLSQNGCRDMFFNGLKLLLRAREWITTWNIGLYDDGQFELVCNGWSITEKRSKWGNIRWNDVVIDVLWPFSAINTCCVNGKKWEWSSGALPKAARGASFLWIRWIQGLSDITAHLPSSSST